MKISTKIYALGAFVLIGITAIVGIFVHALQREEAARQTADHLYAVLGSVEQVRESELQTRRAGEQFLRLRDQQSLELHRQFSDQTSEQIAALRRQLGDGELSAPLQVLDDTFIRYVGQFDALVASMSNLGLDHKSGLLGGLRAAVHEVESELKQHEKLKLSYLMLMMRRHEKDYLARKLDKYVTRMADREREFNAELATTVLPDASRQKIADKMAFYHRSFLAMVAGEQEVNAKLQQMNETIALIAPQLVQISESVDEHRASEFTRLESARDQATWLVSLVTPAITLVVIISLLVVQRALREPIERTLELTNRIAQGDLSVDIQVARHDELGMVMEGIGTLVHELKPVLSSVNHSSNNIHSAVDSINNHHRAMDAEAQRQGESMQLTSEQLEILGNFADRTTDNTRQASDLVRSACTEAEQGSRIIADVVEAMSAINEASDKIAGISSTVDELAFQTGLLSLNAAVEAARAGEQGRGFAVVASEVRQLADRSAAAAKEISSLVEDSNNKVREGVALVGNSGSAFEKLSSSVNEVAALVEAIADGSTQQTNSIEQISGSFREVEQTSRSNQQKIEAIDITLQDLASQANQLKQQITYFQHAEAA